MSRSGAEAQKQYDNMTAEELERELREAFFCTDQIDGPLSEELEKIREALDRKRPVEYLYTPEESWAQFRAEHGEELERRLTPKGKAEAERRSRAARRRSIPALLRWGLIAAAAVLLLAGAALAADSLDLIAWSPRWNADTERYEPVARETVGKGTVLAALTELGITEPVYPTRLPEGFVITESRISKDPLVLMEQYARGDERLSVTITPLKGFDAAVYQREGESAREYSSGKTVHYMIRSEGTITAVWCTDHYAVSVSGNLSLNEIKGIIDSVYASPKGGPWS